MFLKHLCNHIGANIWIYIYIYVYIYIWQFGIHVYCSYSSLPLEIHCWILAGARNMGDV